jgi:hypothetical protein
VNHAKTMESHFKSKKSLLLGTEEEHGKLHHKYKISQQMKKEHLPILEQLQQLAASNVKWGM